MRAQLLSVVHLFIVLLTLINQQRVTQQTETSKQASFLSGFFPCKYTRILACIIVHCRCLQIFMIPIRGVSKKNQRSRNSWSHSRWRDRSRTIVCLRLVSVIVGRHRETFGSHFPRPPSHDPPESSQSNSSRDPTWCYARARRVNLREKLRVLYL